MMIMIQNRLGGKKAAAVMIRKKGGIAAHSSNTRDRNRSVHPPRKPASAPSPTPMSRDMPTETNPMVSEYRVP